MENLGQRKAELTNMVELAGYLRMEFVIPARGLIGFRAQFLTATKGNGIMNHVFHGYATIQRRNSFRTRGALVAFENGETTPYGLELCSRSRYIVRWSQPRRVRRPSYW